MPTGRGCPCRPQVPELPLLLNRDSIHAPKRQSSPASKCRDAMLHVLVERAREVSGEEARQGAGRRHEVVDGQVR